MASRALLFAATALLLACASPSTAKRSPRASSTSQARELPLPNKTAHARLQALDEELRRLTVVASLADWERSTNITDATEREAVVTSEALMAFTSSAIREAAQLQDDGTLDDRDRRMLALLVRGVSLPAPDDPSERRELAELAAHMESAYARARVCTKPDQCLDIDAANEQLGTSRDPAQQLALFRGWHEQSAGLRPQFTRFVQLANRGANTLGFADLGQLWLSRYDMPPAAFRTEVERLWQAVRPLYEELHCYARKRLSTRYGRNVVPSGGPIPAHLLGNMWAQEWTALYPELAPYPKLSPPDVGNALQKQGYDEAKLARLGESFFRSLGFDALPETFWQRSLLKKPTDRDVVCHGSAWDVTFANDLRIKMCVRINHEDMVTLHHELGHIYYFNQYYTLPFLLQEGANDGFHEAIGDAIALSITPAYLAQVGLATAPRYTPEAALNLLMFRALDKVAFLPFARMVDEWRLKVFAGEITPDHYNESWWQLRTAYQGVTPVEPITEQTFDPGAKYHVAANVPYTRYFLATILEYQMHQALCREAGHTGPLHECSIYGNTQAGTKLRAMLALGATRPWPEALALLTGQQTMDPAAMLEYFQPLSRWLRTQLKGVRCGW